MIPGMTREWSDSMGFWVLLDLHVAFDLGVEKALSFGLPVG